jgi:peptidoglycan/LPS O-acetylase OafA/YrhL
MWNAVDIIIERLFPFIIGVLIRYASRKWDRPLLVTVCLIFVIIVMDLVISVKNSTFSAYLQTHELRVTIFVIMIFGALIADLIYRIAEKNRKE